MGRREDEVRERMERDADVARGLGGMLGLDDMRYYGEELSWAAFEDAGGWEASMVMDDGEVEFNASFEASYEPTRAREVLAFIDAVERMKG
jgi:hypothetical protein